MLARLAQTDRLLAVFQGAGLIGCAASTYLTIHLCAEARGDMGWVTMAIGAVLEACKYAFAIRGSMLWSSDRGKATALLVVSAALVFGSITASVGYLVETDNDRAVSEVKRSVLYQAVNQQMMNTHNSIVITEGIADKYTDISYNAKALKAMKENEKRQQEYMGLARELHQMESNPDAVLSSSAMLAGIGAIGGATGAEVRGWLYAAIAILLEACSIFAMVFSPPGKKGLLWLVTGHTSGPGTGTGTGTGSGTSRSTSAIASTGSSIGRPPGTSDEPDTTIRTRVQAQAPTIQPGVRARMSGETPGTRPILAKPSTDTGTSGEGGAGYASFLRYIRTCNGAIPVREAMSKLSIGQKRATEYFEKAVSDGELERDGRSYKMAYPPIRRRIED